LADQSKRAAAGEYARLARLMPGLVAGWGRHWLRLVTQGAPGLVSAVLGRPACESPGLALLARTGGMNWRLCDYRQAWHDGAKGLIFGAGGDMPLIQKLSHQFIIHVRHEDRAK
jgi:hypothetical protein